MARIDKYDPVDGGFRAALAGSWAGSATPVGVGLDANGKVVAGAGVTGVIGVLCKPDAAAAGDIVDVMTDGELVEFSGAAGTVYYAATADGAISTTATGVRIGHTVEASRLIVRCNRGDVGTTVVGDQSAVADWDMTLLAAAGTPDDASEAIPDPGDTPVDADALRDDLVANALPAIRNNFEDLGTKLNLVITRLEAAGLLTETP